MAPHASGEFENAFGVDHSTLQKDLLLLQAWRYWPSIFVTSLCAGRGWTHHRAQAYIAALDGLSRETPTTTSAS